MLNGRDLYKPTNVIRPPSIDENIENWIALVIAKDPTVNDVDIKFGTLNDRPLKKILKTDKERDFVEASYELLRSSIRNRDAHRYTRNVRAFHFRAVESLFVPAFDILLETLDQHDLRDQLKDIGA